jgi:hypothetical protein
MLVRRVIFSLLFLAPCTRLLIKESPAQPMLSSSAHIFTVVRRNDDLPAQTSKNTIRKSAVAIVKQIQRADYEGDRTALKKLFADLLPFSDDREIGARVLYWRGFALWRRAFNGTSASSNELEEDLTSAAKEFEKAIERDPGFVDAKIGAASCWQNISALYYVGRDLSHAREYMQGPCRCLRKQKPRNQTTLA